MNIFDNIIDFFIYADKISLTINILLFLVIRVLLCIAVYSNAERKKLSEIRTYAELVVIFGIVGYIVFMLLTRKIKCNEKKGREVVFAVISVVLICANIALFSYTDESAELNYKTQFYGFDSSVGIFEAENGDKIRYNNLGQGFSLKNMDAFFYQAESGERYIYVIAKDTIDRYSVKDGCFIGMMPEYCFNSKGYFCNLNDGGYYQSVCINDELRVIIDNNGELYYDIENCYFDENGDFIFTDEKLYNLTYDLAVKYLQNDEEFNYEYIYKNDDGLYVYYDKLGNEYNICDDKEFSYQDKFGKVYVDPDEDFLVDENGYICFSTDLSYCDVSSSAGDMYTIIYYDSNGNLYYSIDDCYWDKDGNLKLSKAVADITYEQIMSSDHDETIFIN